MRGHLRRRGSKWVVIVDVGRADDGHRKQKWHSGFDTKRDASKALTEILGRLQRQEYTAPRKQTVGSFLMEWLDSARTSLRPRTFAGYASIVNAHLIPGLGHIRLQDLGPTHVEAHLRRTSEAGLSNRTVQYHHAVLRRALGQAEKWGLLSRNVARLVTVPRVQRRDVQPLSSEQARHLLAGVRDDRLSALYAVSLSLGLRQGEALGLRWVDIDFEGQTLAVRHSLQRYGGAYHLDEPKTDRSRRTIGLPTPLADALRQHMDRQLWERRRSAEMWEGERWGLVFCSDLGGPLDGSAVTRSFQRHLARLDLPVQRFHDLRHAAATFLIAQNVPLRVVMEILGHSTITTTANVYGHVSPDLQRDATDRTAAILFG